MKQSVRVAVVRVVRDLCRARSAGRIVLAYWRNFGRRSESVGTHQRRPVSHVVLVWGPQRERNLASRNVFGLSRRWGLDRRPDLEWRLIARNQRPTSSRSFIWTPLTANLGPTQLCDPAEFTYTARRPATPQHISHTGSFKPRMSVRIASTQHHPSLLHPLFSRCPVCPVPRAPWPRSVPKPSFLL
jgi:hypothetical protein